MKKLWWIGLGLGVLAVAYAGWLLWAPQAIIDHYTGKVPEQWAQVCTLKTYRDIQAKLGPPDEDLGVKGMQNYVLPRWFGADLLSIGGDASQLDTSPRYIAHVVVIRSPLFLHLHKIGRGHRMCEAL